MIALRALRIGALLAAWLAGTLLGTGAAALRTDAGRNLVVAEGLRRANAELNGRLTIAQSGGSLIAGLVVSGVRLVDIWGRPVLSAERLQVRYRVQDLLAGRVSLGQVILVRPVVDLIQRTPAERFNFEQVLPHGGGRGSAPLIAFTDVRIIDAQITIQTPDGASYRVRHIDHLTTRLAYLRLSSPRPDDPIRAEIGALSAQVSDPAVGISELQGAADVWSDSLGLTLGAVRLGRTSGTVRGKLRWPADTILFDLELAGRFVATDELLGLVPKLPAPIEGRGNFVVRSLNGSVLEFHGTDLQLDGVPDGGRLEGRLGLVLGPGNAWAARDTRLRLRDFDLEFVRGLLDTLPLAGRLDGTVAADGPSDSLALDVDVAFRDSLVDGWPRSTARAAGVIELNAADGAVFHALHLDSLDLDLASARRLIAGLPLQGRLRGKGTLGGPWLDAVFDGSLEHEDAPLPATRAAGLLRFDARGDTLGVWADLEFDSLRLAGLERSYPGIALPLAFAGHVSLAGHLDSLALDAQLAGAAGAFDARGAVYATDERAGAHALDVTFHALDAHTISTKAPDTRLAGALTVRGGSVTGRPLALRGDVTLDSGSVAGVPLDSARATVTLGDSVMTVNVLRLWLRSLDVQGGGRLGMATPRSGTMTISAVSDSVGGLEPLLARWLGALAEDSTPASGTLAGSVTVEGALDAFTATVALQANRLRRNDEFVSHAEARGRWESGTRSLTMSAVIDSLGTAGLGFGGIIANGSGWLDSLQWFARSRFGAYSAWIGGGRLTRDSLRSTVTLDSLGLLLNSGIWFAERGATIAVGDSDIAFSDLTFTSVRHAGRVTLAGRFPFAGSGNVSASIEALPLADVWSLAQRESETVAGEVSGTLEMSGSPRQPVLDVRLGLRDGVFGEFHAPVVRAEGHYRDRRVTIDATLHRAGEQILHIQADAPVDLALTHVEQRELPGPVTIRAVAQGVDLSLLEATTPAIRSVSGTLDADLGIAGTWERPELTGGVGITNGAASFPALGVRHEAINARLVLRGDTIFVDRFGARSGQGTAQIAGYVRLEQLSRPVLNLKITGQNFRAIDLRDFLSLTASGNMDLTGPFFNATLTGTATANRGALYFADLIEKDVINLQDTLYREFLDTTIVQRQNLGPAIESRFLDSLRVDSVRVDIGSDVWLRSGEANIQLAGAVTVSKLRNQYRLTGAMQTPRGTYRLELPPPTPIAKDFTVTRGQVRYFGTPDLDADLDIEAQHVVRTVRGDQVTVFVHIGGTLYEPKLTLSSDIRPAVSETEVISYLLFGAPSVQAFSGSGVGSAGKSVAQNVLAMLSGRVEYSLVSDLNIPLDYFQIRPGRAQWAGTEIAIGKQFSLFGTTAFVTASPRVCANQQAGAGANVRFGASLEFRLSRQWLLSTSVDPSRSCGLLASTTPDVYQFGLDLFWEKSF